MASIIFTDGTLWARTKIGMINICLQAIGETPFPEGTLVEDLGSGTDGSIASDTVERTMIEVQNRGWYFNTDYNFKLYPDDNSFITVPPNILRIDVGNTYNKHKVILKGNRLYDMENKTFKFDTFVEADVVWLTDYSELPPAAYMYIALRAARKFQQSVIGSTETHNFTMQDEIDSLTNMQREHHQYQDYNLTAERVVNRNSNAWLKGPLWGAKGRR